MNTYSINLQKAPATNPLPEIIEAIPYSESLLDVVLLDTITSIMLRHGYVGVSNSMIVLLLIDINKTKLIKIQEVAFPSILGKALLVQRNINGK